MHKAAFIDGPRILAHPATPALLAAHAAVKQYRNPTSRRGSPQVSDARLFQRIDSGEFDSSDLIEFLKREEVFWRPICDLANRPHLRDIVAALKEEVGSRP